MLRVRLILWYSLLVVLTIIAIGFVQNFIIQRSLIETLDTSLTDDARATLNLVNALPATEAPERILEHGKMQASGSLREIIDHVLTEVDDTLRGRELTDRVMSHLIDEILAELSYDETAPRSSDPLESVIQRTVSSRRNNLVEIHFRTSGTTSEVPEILFRTRNLQFDTLASLVNLKAVRDTVPAGIIGEARFRGERIRVAMAASPRFIVLTGYPTIDITDSIGRLQSSFLYLIPLALLVSTLGGLWLARKALRPIEQIADTAREISAKNLSRRIRLPGKTDRELGILTTTLNSMFERLERSFKQVSQFTSDASHELKTPLAIMKGEIEQAHRHLERARILPPAEGEELLESLMEEVDRMQRIVEGLLLLSKADDRKLPLALEQVNLYDFLGSLAEDASILAEDRQLKLETRFDPNARECVLELDSTRIYQVVMNLLDNAIKYNRPNGTVTLFLTRLPHSIEFGVEDTGQGISSEDLPRIFQRFFRSDEARTGPDEHQDRSLGLGLAIVKSIVEAHQGSIRVESTPNLGTRFSITFPFGAPSDDLEPKEGESVLARTRKSFFGRRTRKKR